MSRKMSNAPVYLTVAQIQFNPVLNLENYIPLIQDKMRIVNFPDFKRQTQQAVMPFDMSSSGVQIASPNFLPQVRCIFGDIEGESMFVLENNGLSFQTTAYDTFPVFSKILLDGLATVHQVLKLNFTERIGLRYLDVVLPQPGEFIKDYLVSEVLGLSRKLDGQMLHSFNETVTVTSAGQLVSRVIIQDGTVGLPLELAPLAPRVQLKFSQYNGHHAVIDTDAFLIKREGFNLDFLKLRLEALHDEILKSFQATVTAHALSVWS